MAAIDIDLEDLSKRLAAARCWRDERGCMGTRYTKWFDLEPTDVVLAARILHAIAKQNKEPTP